MCLHMLRLLLGFALLRDRNGLCRRPAPQHVNVAGDDAPSVLVVKVFHVQNREKLQDASEKVDIVNDSANLLEQLFAHVTTKVATELKNCDSIVRVGVPITEVIAVLGVVDVEREHGEAAR